MLRLRRKHIKNTAANGKLTGAFDLYTALVACARERLCQLIQRRGFTGGQRHDCRLERLRRHGALGCRLHGRDRKMRFRQLVQCCQTALLVAARHTDYIRHHQLTRGQLYNVTLGKTAQISCKSIRSVVIVGQNQYRTAGVQS